MMTMTGRGGKRWGGRSGCGPGRQRSRRASGARRRARASSPAAAAAETRQEADGCHNRCHRWRPRRASEIGIPGLPCSD
uniref:Uncharacterized protein n=1 Tax=Arundo donax TaxID=35708 RepID=A0A0A9H4A4_ARUDO